MNFLKREGITLRQYFWMIWIDLDPDPGCFHGHVTLSDFQLRSLLADLFECDFSNSCAAVDKISTVKCLCPKIAMTQSWVKRTSMHSQPNSCARNYVQSLMAPVGVSLVDITPVWHLYHEVRSQASSSYFSMTAPAHRALDNQLFPITFRNVEQY